MQICCIYVTGSETGITEDSFRQFRMNYLFQETITLFVVHFDL